MKTKTRKAADKRFKVTKNNKILRGHAYSSHLQASKSKSRRRRQDEPTEVSPADKKRLNMMLPYSG